MSRLFLHVSLTYPFVYGVHFAWLRTQLKTNNWRNEQRMRQNAIQKLHCCYQSNPLHLHFPSAHNARHMVCMFMTSQMTISIYLIGFYWTLHFIFAIEPLNIRRYKYQWAMARCIRLPHLDSRHFVFAGNDWCERQTALPNMRNQIQDTATLWSTNKMLIQFWAQQSIDHRYVEQFSTF